MPRPPTSWRNRALATLCALNLLGAPGLRAEPPPPVELAVIAPQSGLAEAYGRPAIRGARLAAEEVNQQGGLLGRPLALVVLDNQSSPLRAKQAAELAIRRGVLGVVGDLWSTHSLAIAPLLQKAGIPMVSPGSTAPDVTRVGDCIFRVCYTDDFQGELMAGFARQSLGGRTAAVLVNISETYSQALGSFFAKAFVAQGGLVVFQGGYKGTAVDFADLLEHLAASAPEVVFIPGYARDSGLFIRQARGRGLAAAFLGGDAWDASIVDFAGAALEGSCFSTPWHPGVPYPRSREFIARYRAAYGEEEISPFAPLAYDAVRLLAAAAQRAGSLAPAQVREALAATRDFPGATGTFAFDEHGDPRHKGASILQFQQGQWRFLRAFEPRQDPSP